MIELSTWLSQIIGYCEFVVDDVKLRHAWIDRDFSETSVTDFDELYEQIFDDLDADRYLVGLGSVMPGGQHAELAIGEFLKSLQKIDSANYKVNNLFDTSRLLASEDWRSIRSAARAALRAVQ